jgi:flagellar biosynthesis/type III secretory pathway protein FliH
MQMMASFLESFADADTLPAQAPSPDHAAAYAEGYAAAMDDIAATNDRLEAELVQTLSDMAFTYRAARQDVIDALEPLVQTLIQSVLPHCITNGFADQIAAAVLQDFTDQAGSAVRVNIHPDQLAPVRNATRQLAADVLIAADPHLSRHAAWIGSARGEVSFDMDRHLAAITALLANLSTQQQEVAQNG